MEFEGHFQNISSVELMFCDLNLLVKVSSKFPVLGSVLQCLFTLW